MFARKEVHSPASPASRRQPQDTARAGNVPAPRHRPQPASRRIITSIISTPPCQPCGIGCRALLGWMLQTAHIPLPPAVRSPGTYCYVTLAPPWLAPLPPNDRRHLRRRASDRPGQGWLLGKHVKMHACMGYYFCTSSQAGTYTFLPMPGLTFSHPGPRIRLRPCEDIGRRPKQVSMHACMHCGLAA